MTSRAIAVAIALTAALAGSTGCGDRATPEAAPAPSPPAPPLPRAVRVDAADLIAKFQCARCHEVPAIAAAPRDKHCVHCHQEIHAGTFIVDAPTTQPDDGRALAAGARRHEVDAPTTRPDDGRALAAGARRREIDAPTLARWRGRITSLRWAPSLAGADRLRRTWVRDYFLTPHDVRPGLVAQMPRLAITPAEAERLAAYLVQDRAGAARAGESHPVARGDRADLAKGHGAASGATVITVDAQTVTRGEALYRSLACGRCHRFSGAATDDASLHASGRDQVEPLGGSWALAPDLRHARVRMEAMQIAAWIADPRGAMPRLGIDADDAAALAAFLVTTPLAAPAAPPAIERRPVLARAVTWDEVEAKVFRNVCWHCHAVPDYARGDGGPGNSGGFGFAPRGLDLSSYTGISAGSLDDAGEPRSVFAKLDDGTPRIVAHLLARHTEEGGGAVPGIRGMPLGLPALPLEDIQLVETWINQGRPR